MDASDAVSIFSVTTAFTRVGSAAGIDGEAVDDSAIYSEAAGVCSAAAGGEREVTDLSAAAAGNGCPSTTSTGAPTAGADAADSFSEASKDTGMGAPSAGAVMTVPSLTAPADRRTLSVSGCTGSTLAEGVGVC